ncbi:hypothetical protein B0O99DRAFT_640277, partial [Bisporella sp. PMI_857]
MDLISDIIRRERPGEAITRRRQYRLARKYHQEKMPQVHEMKLNFIGRSFRQARKRQRNTAMEAYVYNAQMLESRKRMEHCALVHNTLQLISTPSISTHRPNSPRHRQRCPSHLLTTLVSNVLPPSPIFIPDTDVMFMPFGFYPGNPESRFEGGISGPVIFMCNTSARFYFSIFADRMNATTMLTLSKLQP